MKFSDDGGVCASSAGEVVAVVDVVLFLGRYRPRESRVGLLLVNCASVLVLTLSPLFK